MIFQKGVLPIAVTRIIPMHISKGKTAIQSLSARLNYATNPSKTKNGELVTAYACDPHTADAEFALSRRQYQTYTGRTQKHEVIAYQVRQSFKPGEVTPEEANAIGYEFANRFLKGNHAFIVATHIDRSCVHNHIEWNAVSLDAHHKFKDFSFSARAVARLSDMICLEHKLSVIKHPQHTGKTYDKWLGDRAVPSHRDVLRADIDQALKQKPANMDALLDGLKTMGYEIKHGKQLSFRKAGQKRFIRMDTLGNAYSYDALSAVLAGLQKHRPKTKPIQQDELISKAIDAQRMEAKGKGYTYWAKNFNSKQYAKSILFLTENHLSIDDLPRAVEEACTKADALTAELKKVEAQIASTSQLIDQVRVYLSSVSTYKKYKASGWSRSFFAEHESEIRQYKQALLTFDEAGYKTVPKLKVLYDTLGQLKAQRRELIGDYAAAKKTRQELLTVQANLNALLSQDKKERTRSDAERS